MRFGIHSGPVTAGVLRGDKQRFQLFGDTVNTGTTSFNCLQSKIHQYFLSNDTHICFYLVRSTQRLGLKILVNQT